VKNSSPAQHLFPDGQTQMGICRLIAVMQDRLKSVLGETTLVLCAHQKDSEHTSPVEIHANALFDTGHFGDVAIGYLADEPSFDQVVKAIKTPRVLVVPFLMSAGHTYKQVFLAKIRDLLHEFESLNYTSPIGLSHRLPDLITTLALRACEQHSWSPQETMLVLVGHGTDRDRDSSRAAENLASIIRQNIRFADCQAIFLNQEPRRMQPSISSTTRHVVGIGMFAGLGQHARLDAPRLLADYAGNAPYLGPIGAQSDMTYIVLDHVLIHVRTSMKFSDRYGA
jgi:sirohydrochlorin ferrochelatase